MKTPSQSRTECSHIVVPEHLNGVDRLFGGTLISWIDDCCAICARRHVRGNVTAATLDNVQFLAPVYQNDTVVCIATVTYTGNTSMEICCKSYVEKLDGSRTLINVAYQIVVAIDDNGRPVPVPKLQPETEEEIAEFEKAEKRRELRKLYR